MNLTQGSVAAQADGRVLFVASDESRDRMGDVVRADGWDLTNFRRNPVALFQHDHNQPIGRVHNARIEGRRLMAEIEFMPDVVSPFTAGIGRMVKEGFLSAVSVGFRPLASAPMKGGGIEFLRQELLELSVVSIPALPSAIAVGRSLFTPDQMERVFDVPAAQPRSRATYQTPLAARRGGLF